MQSIILGDWTANTSAFDSGSFHKSTELVQLPTVGVGPSYTTICVPVLEIPFEYKLSHLHIYVKYENIHQINKRNVKKKKLAFFFLRFAGYPRQCSKEGGKEVQQSSLSALCICCNAHCECMHNSKTATLPVFLLVSLSHVGLK